MAWVKTRIKQARISAGYTQEEFAKKLEVSQALVSQWESGRARPSESNTEKIERVLGALSKAEYFRGSPFGEWLKKSRLSKNLSVQELAKGADVSPLTIYLIEKGTVTRPQKATIDAIVGELDTELPKDFTQELDKESKIEGFGNLTDFDPYDEDNLPSIAGIYVFYDISDRPIYVGQGENIGRRVQDHAEKFWFKQPVVERGSYIAVSDKKMRLRIETLLIKFLKSNAIINIKNVDRGED